MASKPKTVRLQKEKMEKSFPKFSNIETIFVLTLAIKDWPYNIKW